MHKQTTMAIAALYLIIQSCACFAQQQPSNGATIGQNEELRAKAIKERQLRAIEQANGVTESFSLGANQAMAKTKTEQDAGAQLQDAVQAINSLRQAAGQR